MRRLSDRRRRSSDSGIVDVGNSRCPHLNVTCPAHTTIALAPNSVNQVKVYSKQIQYCQHILENDYHKHIGAKIR